MQIYNIITNITEPQDKQYRDVLTYVSRDAHETSFPASVNIVYTISTNFPDSLRGKETFVYDKRSKETVRTKNVNELMAQWIGR